MHANVAESQTSATASLQTLYVGLGLIIKLLCPLPLCLRVRVRV